MCWYVFFFENVQNLWGPAGIGTVVKRNCQFSGHRAELIDIVRNRVAVVSLACKEIRRRVVGIAACAALRLAGEAPDVPFAFENQIRTGGTSASFARVVSSGCVRVPYFPERTVRRSQRQSAVP